MAFYFAQINIARAKYPMEDTRMSDFVNNIPSINSLAEKSPGFVWRWMEDANPRVEKIFGDRALVVNMSVWKNRDALLHFTYKTRHASIYKRRKEWFSKLEDSHVACWYTREIEISLEEAKKRLDYLSRQGETPFAFTLKTEYKEKEVLDYLEVNPSLL